MGVERGGEYWVQDYQGNLRVLVVVQKVMVEEYASSCELEDCELTAGCSDNLSTCSAKTRFESRGRLTAQNGSRDGTRWCEMALVKTMPRYISDVSPSSLKISVNIIRTSVKNRDRLYPRACTTRL